MDTGNQIRPKVRAVIRNGPFVAVQVKQAASGRQYLTLPGGRQEFGESMEDCLCRVCLEEIGIALRIETLLHVPDVFRRSPERTRDLTETLLTCTVCPGYLPMIGPRPDKRQIATDWAAPVGQGAMFLPRCDPALTRDALPVYPGTLTHETP